LAAGLSRVTNCFNKGFCKKKVVDLAEKTFQLYWGRGEGGGGVGVTIPSRENNNDTMSYGLVFLNSEENMPVDMGVHRVNC